MPKEENNEDKKEKKNRFVISEVHQVSGYVVKDTNTDEEYDILSAIAKIMNDIESIKKSVA